MRVFAFDHRLQLEAIADEIGVSRDRIGAFKRLCLKATLKVAAGRPGYGLLCDNRLGRDALHAAAGTGLWIGRPRSALAEWPLEHVVKVLAFYHPDDAPEVNADQPSSALRGRRGRTAWNSFSRSSPPRSRLPPTPHRPR
jgi:5-dehydro-2-deoxygluconokinase